jgi:phosphate/sulfate permease
VLISSGAVAFGIVSLLPVELILQVGLFSPLIGFAVAALLLVVSKLLITDKRLYEAPKGR